MTFPTDQELEPHYQIIAVKSLAEIKSDSTPYQSIMDNKIFAKKGEATITIAQAHYKRFGRQSLHAMLLVERFNQNGTGSVEMIHLTGKSMIQEFLHGHFGAVFKTFTRGNFLSTGEGVVDVRSLALRHEIKYHAKTPTMVVTEENLGIMMQQVYKEQQNPPHFYLLSSHSDLIGIRNLIRTNNFANNCIEWAVRLASYAGYKITREDDKISSIMRTDEYVGDKNISFRPPGAAELVEYARAGNVDALEKYCSKFTVEQINEFVDANAISSSIKEHLFGKMTALHLACIYDQVEVVKWLLAHGADKTLKTQGTYNKWDAERCAKAKEIAITAVQTISLKRNSEMQTKTETALQSVGKDSKQEEMKVDNQLQTPGNFGVFGATQVGNPKEEVNTKVENTITQDKVVAMKLNG